MITRNIPLLCRRSKRSTWLHPDLALWLTLSDSNTPYLEHISTVPRMFEPLMFCYTHNMMKMQQSRGLDDNLKPEQKDTKSRTIMGLSTDINRQMTNFWNGLRKAFHSVQGSTSMSVKYESLDNNHAYNLLQNMFTVIFLMVPKKKNQYYQQSSWSYRPWPYTGRVRRKDDFENTQKAQIQVILCICKVSSGLLPSTHEYRDWSLPAFRVILFWFKFSGLSNRTIRITFSYFRLEPV